MVRLFGRHRVRATFYHVGAAAVLLITGLSSLDAIPDSIALYITLFIFFADYVAEMYDPHPDNPGPWFKSHFHRFLKDDDED